MRVTFWLALFIAFVSCSGDRVYEEFVNLDGTWHEDSVLKYSFDIEDPTIPYRLKMSLTNRHTFPYHNFYFNYTLSDQNDSILSQELFEMILFDPKTGAPLGGGSGNLFNHEFELQTDIKFPGPGSYRVGLSQFMRQEEMTDIERVGVRLEYFRP